MAFFAKQSHALIKHASSEVIMKWPNI